LTADTGDHGALSDPVMSRLETLSGTLDNVAARLQSVAGRERVTRRLAVGLVASLILDVILTVVVTLLSLSAVREGATLHASQLAACAVGNQARAEQVQLWSYVIQLSAQGPHGNQAELRQFKAYIDRTFAPVACARVYP
jgi:hypothetical protein